MIKREFQKSLICLLVFMSFLNNIKAQNSVDSVTVREAVSDSISNIQPTKLNYKSLIIPAAFISYGVIGLSSSKLKQLNFSTRTEINEHQPAQMNLDNFTQYAPAVMVYGLNAIGIKGKHNLRDRTIIYASSQLISAAFTMPLKYLVKEERPISRIHFLFHPDILLLLFPPPNLCLGNTRILISGSVFLDIRLLFLQGYTEC